MVAAAIHAFEIILDLFRQEVDELTAKITPGTKLWYAEMCYRFQNGHTLVFDKNTAQFYYEQDDPDSRIVKVVAVNEVYKMISIRVAKTDGEAGSSLWTTANAATWPTTSTRSTRQVFLRRS